MEKRLIQKAKRNDRVARWAITASGMVIIFAVIGILALIVKVTLPLFFPASGEILAQYPLPGGRDSQNVVALATDEYLETGYLLTRQGEVVFFNAKNGQPLDTTPLKAPGQSRKVEWAEPQQGGAFSLLWSDGWATLEQIGFSTGYGPDGGRMMSHQVSRLAAFAPPPGAKPVKSWVRANGQGGSLRLALTAKGRLHLSRMVVETNFLGEETRSEQAGWVEGLPPEGAQEAVVDLHGQQFYAATPSGQLLRWALEDEGPRLLDSLPLTGNPAAPKKLGLVFGDISLMVAGRDGSVSTWFPVADQSGIKHLRPIHLLDENRPSGQLIPSLTGKTFAALGEDGQIRLYHPTSERKLLTLKGERKATLAAFAPRGNGMMALDGQNGITLWSVHNPHPEVSFYALFQKVWYENYPEPVYAWQSSSASADFEPKLSLVPLIFGTLKGTFYAMLFAAPLAILGAIYTSQLMNPRIHKGIKPAVEIMSAVPTVVIGFLAALWLAPLLERHLLAPFLFLLLLILFLGLTFLAYGPVQDHPWVKRLGRGMEFVLALPAVGLAIWLAATLDGWLERTYFQGDVHQWFFQSTGSTIDQRNSIVISFALGFAVIPAIFTIAEDALSNVPKKLTAASLALGASRWQTVWRVVVPSASPGIFAALMIGFGRAVGETMIVLMATGNTPIMDWSIFNGMRTLSANIAVEIPEAPVNGTLYRVLFLSAVLLFLSTFLFNSLSEVVRQRLRKKYGRY